MRGRPILLTLAIPTLLLLGCGGDDDPDLAGTTTSAPAAGDPAAPGDTGTPGDSATTTPPDTGDEESPPDTSDDQEQVDEAIQVVADELSADGFTRQADDDEDTDIEFESEACERFEDTFGEEVLPGLSADSGSYERGELTLEGGAVETVDVSIGLTPTVEDLDTYFEIIRDERFIPCMQEAIQLLFEKEAAAAGDEGGPTFSFDPIAADQLETSGVGDDAVALRLSSTMRAGSFAFPFSFELEFVRAGRAGVAVMTSVIGGDVVDIERAGLLATGLDAVTG